jgi:exonuclease VII small subunit
MLATYKEAVEEFSSSATEFLAHIPVLTKARGAYQRAIAVSTQVRHILDKGHEKLRLLMGQIEQAANIQVDLALI